MVQFCKHCNQDVEVTLDSVSQSRICSICGSSIAYANYLAPGTILSGFRIEEEIGRGGMGTVYKSLQMNLERDVALKVLSDELSRDEDFVDRFFREARAAASLSHPNIVQAYDAGATPDNLYFFAMELIDGETLELKVQKEGALPEKQALTYGIKISQALEYAFSKQKLSHGDIKPENIILNSYGEAKLADLGLAKKAHEDSNTEVMATPLYAPPEIIKGDVDSINTKSDMYSFGATLYHLLAGEPPFPGDDPHQVMDRHVNEEPVPLLERNPEIHPKLSEYVNKLLSKSPEDRPGTWNEIVKRLEKISRMDRKVFHRAVPHVDNYRSSQMSKQGIIGYAFVAVLVISVSAILYLKKDELLGTERRDTVRNDDDDSMKAKWEDIKKRMKNMGIEKAYAEVTQFSKEFPDAPSEVHNELMILKKKVENIKKYRQKVEKAKTGFTKRLEAKLASLAKVDLNKLDVKELKSLDSDIKKIIGEGKKNKHLASITKNYNPKFQKYSSAICIKLMNLEQEARKKLKEEADRIAAEKKKKEEAKLKVAESRRNQIIKANKPLDEYLLAIGTFYKLSENSRTSDNLLTMIKKWLNQGKKSNTSQKKAQELIAGFSGLKPVEEIFASHSAWFEGIELPSGIVANSKGYKVSAITKDSIKLFKEQGKAKIGKIIKWSSIKRSRITLLIKQQIIEDGNFGSLEYPEQKSIIGELLICRDFESGKILISNIDSRKEMGLWTRIVKDLETAIKERNEILILKRGFEANKEGDIITVAKCFVMLSSAKETDVYKRYSPVIQHYMEEIRKDSPEAIGTDMLNVAKSCFKKNAIYKGLFEAATVNFRYRSLDAVSKKLNADTQNSINFALEKIQERSPIKEVADSKLPFYYWEDDKLGDAIVYYRIVSNSSIFKDNRNILDMLGMAVDVTIGDFSKATEYVNKNPSAFVNLTTVNGPIANWVPALIFAGALTADRLDNSDLKIELLGMIVDMRKRLKPVSMKFFSTYLAAEFALMIRDPERAVEIIKGFDLKTGKSKPRFIVKLPLLHLLALLQQKDVSVASIKKEIGNYKPYLENQSLRGEYWACSFAMKLLQKSYSITSSDVNKVAKINFAAPDICYRIIVDSLSLAFARQYGIDGEIGPLLDVIEKNISNTLVAGELKQRIVTLKLVKGIQDGKPIETIDNLLADHNVSNMLIYPKLLLLKYAYRVKNKEISADKAIKNYTIFTQGSNSISPMESSAGKLLRADASTKLIEEMFRKNSPKTAIWSGIASFVAVKPYSFEKFTKIVNLLRENTEKFSWQELILLSVASEN